MENIFVNKTDNSLSLACQSRFGLNVKGEKEEYIQTNHE